MALFNLDVGGIFPVMLGMEPKEGRRCLGFTLDFSANPSYDVFLKKIYETKQMTTIQTLFINNRNAAGGADVSVVIDANGQQINVSPHSSCYVPILTPKEPQKLVFASSGTGLCLVQLINFFVPPVQFT
jgi:hypothetical protein